MAQKYNTIGDILRLYSPSTQIKHSPRMVLLESEVDSILDDILSSETPGW